MTAAEWHSTLFQFIGVILSFVTFVGSVIAIYYTYQNLKEMRKQLNEQKAQYFEQNRGNLIFYISKSDIGITHDLIIKNFGNSPAKLISLKITPDLDWSKAGQTGVDDFNITKLNNIFLAPQQHIGTLFDFTNYEETELDVEICYTTCEKQFTENYKIDLNYLHKVLRTEPKIDNELQALKYINKSINALSDKFI
ncbi:MAG: hypothetical protein PUD53_01530 [Oscillospiraceae bacterium]|nr:hypothetical protein [Oscillospiraceae bacterium]